MCPVVYLARCSNLFHPSNILSMNSENLEMDIRCPGGICTPMWRSGLNITLLFFFSFVESPSSQEKTLILCFKRKTYWLFPSKKPLNPDKWSDMFVICRFDYYYSDMLRNNGYGCIFFNMKSGEYWRSFMLLHPVENAPLELPKGLVPRFCYHPKTEKEKEQRTQASCILKKEKKPVILCHSKKERHC